MPRDKKPPPAQFFAPKATKLCPRYQIRSKMKKLCERAGVDPDDFDEALALFNQVERVQSARE